MRSIIIMFVSGLLCLAFGGYQLQYTRLIHIGNQATAENRFDTQAYQQADRYWLANHALLAYNQGILHFRAQRFRAAIEFFKQAAQSPNPQIREWAAYNWGLLLLVMQDTRGAVEQFKTALRLNPRDTQAKYILEQLYQMMQQQQRQQEEANLEQAPGLQPPDKERENRGAGRNPSSPPDI